MLVVTTSFHSRLATIYTPFRSLKMLCSLKEHPYKPSFLVYHGGKHSLHQIDVKASQGYHGGKHF